MGCGSSVATTTTKKESKEASEEYKKAFKLFDLNGTGRISADDLSAILHSFGHNPTDHDVTRMVNDDGYIDLPEFMSLLSMMNNTDDLQTTFRLFDRDGNGYISAPELRRIARLIDEDYTAAECEEMIQQADVDGDGQVNFSEFVSFYKS